MSTGVNKVDITVYNPVGDHYNKTIVKNCIWKQSEISEFKNLGVNVVDIIKIYISYNPEYVNLIKRGGNIRLGSEKKASYIVKGICPFNFTKSNDKTEINNSIREFESNYDYVKARSIKENTMGSKKIWHVKVVC